MRCVARACTHGRNARSVGPRGGTEEAQGDGCPGEEEPWDGLPLSPMGTLRVLRDVQAGGKGTQGQTQMEASTLRPASALYAEGILSLADGFEHNPDI